MKQQNVFSCRLVGQKGLADDKDLAKINRDYAGMALTKDEVFVSRAIVCHNLIDRDKERFPEDLIDDFARTLPGKSLLRSHDKATLPLGLFFDAYAEEMTTLDFAHLSGSFLELPPGTSKVKVLFGKFYIVRDAGSLELIKKIEAGVVRFVSIGFGAADLVKKSGGGVEFWEYVAPGEAYEGSLVWLGAQPGAMVKGAGNEKGTAANDHNPLIPGGGDATKGAAVSDNPLIPRSESRQVEMTDNPLIPATCGN